MKVRVQDKVIEIPKHLTWQDIKAIDNIADELLKDAVEGEIVRDIHNLLHIKSAPLPMPSEYHFGDKVKIIILPREYK